MRVNAGFSRLLRLDGIWVRGVRFNTDRVVVTVALRRRRQPCYERLEVAREPGTMASERDGLHTHAVLGALQPAQLRAQLQAPNTEIEMAPSRRDLLTVVTMPGRVAAQRATQPHANRSDDDRAAGPDRLGHRRADHQPRLR